MKILLIIFCVAAFMILFIVGACIYVGTANADEKAANCMTTKFGDKWWPNWKRNGIDKEEIEDEESNNK